MKGNDVAALFAVLIPLTVLVYVAQVLNGIPLADEWRWLSNLLIPLLNEKISFFEFITGEYSFLGHTHFLTLIAIFINFKVSMLEMINLAYWGMIYYFAGWVLLIWAVQQSRKSSDVINWIGLLGITAPYFTLTTDFPWLLVVYEYFYYFLAIAILIIFDQYIISKVKLKTILIVTFLGSVLLDSFGVVAILSGIFVVLLGVENKNNKYIVIPLILLAYGLAWIILRMVLGEGIPAASTSRLIVLQALVSRPLDIVQSLLISFSQPIIDKSILVHYFSETYRLIQMLIGLIGFTFVSAIAVIYWKKINSLQSHLPLLLISFGFIAWLLILLTRYLDFGIAVFDSQRFARFFVLYYVGAGAALYIGSFRTILVIIYSVVFVLLFAVTAIFQFNNIENVKIYFENAASALKQHHSGSHVIGKYIGQCANNYCDETIDFLRKIDVPMVSRN